MSQQEHVNQEQELDLPTQDEIKVSHSHQSIQDSHLALLLPSF